MKRGGTRMLFLMLGAFVVTAALTGVIYFEVKAD